MGFNPVNNVVSIFSSGMALMFVLKVTRQSMIFLSIPVFGSATPFVTVFTVGKNVLTLFTVVMMGMETVEDIPPPDTFILPPNAGANPTTRV